MSAEQFNEINEALGLLNAAYASIVLAGIAEDKRYRIEKVINQAEMLIKEEIQ